MVHQSKRRAALEQLLELTTLLGEGMEADATGRGLTIARTEVIWVLHLRGPMRQRDLADALRVSPRNVTGLVDGLEATGFAVRERHPHDRRASLVELTELGSAVAEALVADQEDFVRFLFRGISDVQLDQLRSVLGAVLDRLRSPAYGDVRQAALERWSARRAVIDDRGSAQHAPTRSA
jgi:DNA-binding MarR family transcriptional regulator